MPRKYYLISLTWQGGHVGGQNNTILFHRICIKIKFSSQQRDRLLLLTTNMAAMTSRAIKQCTIAIMRLGTVGKLSRWRWLGEVGRREGVWLFSTVLRPSDNPRCNAFFIFFFFLISVPERFRSHDQVMVRNPHWRRDNGKFQMKCMVLKRIQIDGAYVTNQQWIKK